MKAAHALLDGAIDYAGLFPPAGLDLPTAARNYAAYREGELSWALGRFVLQASRLPELQKCAGTGLAGWGISLLIEAESTDDVRMVCDAGAVVDAIECRVSDVEQIAAVRNAIPERINIYFEIPAEQDTAGWIAAVSDAGARAKLRTGGVTADAIPSSSTIASFISHCAAAGVAFKATAGLHHPLRSQQSLTYRADAPQAVMHGYVNIFFAAALLHMGADKRTALDVLEDESPDSWRCDTDAIHWRDESVSADQMLKARNEFAIGFGSCSFTEPLQELYAMGWL